MYESYSEGAISRMAEHRQHVKINRGDSSRLDQGIAHIFDVLGRITHGDKAWTDKPGGVEHMFEEFQKASKVDYIPPRKTPRKYHV